MTTHGPRRGLAAAAAAAALILQLLLAAWMFTTDGAHVYFLNRPVPETCAWKTHYGVPCPACGWTRATVLTLHGEPAAGWRTNPTGPLTVLGIAGTALVLLLLAAHQRLRGATPKAFRLTLVGGLVLYSFTTCLIGLLAWLRLIAAR